jgi:hypothetical protein
MSRYYDPENPAPTDTSPLLLRSGSGPSLPEQPSPRLPQGGNAGTARQPPTSSPKRVQSPIPPRSAPSPTPSDEDLPTNVSTLEQLNGLPPECLSGDPICPLQHFDENGVVHKYSLNPIMYSVLFVLIVEGERLFLFLRCCAGFVMH